MIGKLAQAMKDKKILPELEAFDAGMLNYAGYMEKKGLLSAPHYVNLIVGNIACAQADLAHIGLMIRDLPENSLWSLGGVGDVQLMVNSIAIACGGGVRVGLEDNIWMDAERTRLAKNIDLVKRIKAIADANGRKIMSPASLRERLKLQPGNGYYGLL
jgi:3-keto-5-aminohexanoate cleavage enzyme